MAVPAQVLILPGRKVKLRYSAAATFPRADEPPALASKPAGRGRHLDFVSFKMMLPAQGIGQRSVDDQGRGPERPIDRYLRAKKSQSIGFPAPPVAGLLFQ